MWAVAPSSWSGILEDSRLNKSQGTSQLAAPVHGLHFSSCLHIPALTALDNGLQAVK